MAINYKFTTEANKIDDYTDCLIQAGFKGDEDDLAEAIDDIDYFLDEAFELYPLAIEVYEAIGMGNYNARGFSRTVLEAAQLLIEAKALEEKKSGEDVLFVIEDKEVYKTTYMDALDRLNSKCATWSEAVAQGDDAEMISFTTKGDAEDYIRDSGMIDDEDKADMLEELKAL